MKVAIRALAVAAVLIACGCAPQALMFGLRDPKIEVTGPLPIDLAFRDAKGLVILSGRVNDRADVSFILDTGAPVSVLLDGRQTRALGLDTRTARPLGDPDDPAVPVGIIQGDFRWTFDRLALSQLTAVVIPESRLPCRERFDEIDFGGVIGADLFRHFVVDIDSPAKRVRLHDPAAWRAPEGSASVPLVFRSGHPFMSTKLTLASGEVIDHELHLDIGLSRALTLVAGSHPSLVMPVDGARRTSCLVSGTQEERVGAAVSVTVGGVKFPVEGPVYSEGSRIKLQRAGSAGLALFAGRRLAIDYPGRRILILG